MYKRQSIGGNIVFRLTDAFENCFGDFEEEFAIEFGFERNYFGVNDEAKFVVGASDGFGELYFESNRCGGCDDGHEIVGIFRCEKF